MIEIQGLFLGDPLLRHAWAEAELLVAEALGNQVCLANALRPPGDENGVAPEQLQRQAMEIVMSDLRRGGYPPLGQELVAEALEKRIQERMREMTPPAEASQEAGCALDVLTDHQAGGLTPEDELGEVGAPSPPHEPGLEGGLGGPGGRQL